MLYPKCPTCKTILGNKQIPFENGIKEICDNEDLNSDQQYQAKMDLLDKLEVKRYCCRMRMLTYVKYINIVK